MSWRRTKLGDVCAVNPRDPVLPGDAPFVPMAMVEVGARHPIGYEQRGSRAGARARANDVLFARITPCLENGKVAQLPPDAPPTGGSTEFLVVRPGPDLDPGFAYYWALTPDVRGQAESNMTGTTGRMRLSARDLAEFMIDYPDDICEQRRIVALLEDYLSRLEAASMQLSKAARRADALVASSLVMHTTCAAGSEGFRSSTVGAEAVLTEYGTSAKCAALQDMADVPVIRMGNLRDGGLDWTNLKYLPVNHEQFPKLLLQHGDLLFNRTNSAELVGKAAVFNGASPSSFASYLIRVRFKDSVDPWWANMVINSPAGRRYVRSVVSQQVGQANVNGTKLKAFPLPLPGRDEQERRVAEHRDVVAARERLRAEAGALMARSDLLRRALLTAAFSGRLTRDRRPLDTNELVSL